MTITKWGGNGMNAQQVQERLGSFHFHDARILKMDSTNLGDEVQLVLEHSDGNVHMLFSGCLRFLFSAGTEDRKTPPNVQEIQVTDVIKDERELLRCRVTAPPMIAEIVCSSIEVREAP